MEIEERKILLEKVISYHARLGYRVGVQTDYTAQLIKPKQFSLFFAVLLFLFFILPFLLYLLYYLAQKDKTIYVVINEQGKISMTDEKGQIQVIDSTDQLAPLTFSTAKKENDPGYSNSTMKALIILAVLIIFGLLVSIIVNLPAR